MHSLLLLVADSSSSAATREAAPWWGTPLIAGGFLVIGAVVAFVSSYVVKKRELERLDQARWDTEILDTSVELINQARKLADGWTVKWEDATDEQRGDRGSDVNKFLVAVQPPVQRLALIGSTRLNKAVDRLVNAAIVSPDVARSEDTPDHVAQLLNINFPTVDEAMDEYIKVVRQEVRAKK